MTPRIQQARAMAIKAHGDQKYGNYPYSVHLEAVVLYSAPFGEDAQVIAYLHDALEDTSLTREEIAWAFGPLVVSCVEALSDPPGVNRKARKEAAYAKLGAISAEAPERLALVVKAADRLANVQACVTLMNPGLFKMYDEEHPTFVKAVLRPDLNDVLINITTTLLKVGLRP